MIKHNTITDTIEVSKSISRGFQSTTTDEYLVYVVSGLEYSYPEFKQYLDYTNTYKDDQGSFVLLKYHNTLRN